MNPGKGKAPEGAQMMTNPDTGIPESQGFSGKSNIPPVGQWLCRTAFNASSMADANDDAEVVAWDELTPDEQVGYWVFAQCVLATMLGIEVTEMILAGKAEILATAKAFDKGVQNG